MDYIADTLGIKVSAGPRGSMANLPFYLVDAYACQLVTLGGMKCLFVKPKGELAALSSVKRHLAKIAEQTDAPLVLDLIEMNARQRKALIAAHIPFVVEDNQLYLPFIGVVLQERYISRQAPSEVFSPTAQLVLFRYLYQDESEMYTSELAKLFGLSVMQITRAVKQLASLGLITTRKDGVRIVIAGTESGSALFDKAIPHLLNPVRKKFYVEQDALPPNLPFAGVSALSEYTMLNPPNITTFAFDGKVNELHGTAMLVDADAQAEIEVWRYPPMLLSQKDNLPDPLSLWATLADDDARIEIAKGELLAEIWRNE
jgi:DNA-binding MarR family transcriptional regulator